VAVDAGTIYSEVRIALDKLKGDIRQVEQSFDQIGKTTKGAADQTQASWQQSFKAVAAASVVAFAAVVLAIKGAIGTFAGFEQAVANVQSVARATPAEFEKIKAAAAEAGETTRFTASQAADAMYYLASAGFNASQSIDALNGVLYLAGATQSDLAFTSEAVAAAISQFSLKASDSTKVANVFTAAIQNSQATMSKLATSMSTVGPIASALGYSIEDTAGILQVLYNAGLDAGTAGTSLRQVLLSLSDQTGPTIKKFAELGITFDQINPAANSFSDILDVLAAAGVGAQEALSGGFFEARSAAAIATLLERGGDEVRKFTAAVTDTNAAAEAYAVQNDTLAGSQDRLKSVIEGAAISITDNFAPVIRGVVDVLAAVVGWIAKLPGPLQVFLTVLGVGIPTVLAAGAAVAFLSTTLAGAGVAIGALLLPVTLGVAAAAALAAAITLTARAAKGQLFMQQEEIRLRELNEELLKSARDRIDDVTASTNALTRAQIQNLRTEATRQQQEILGLMLEKQRAEADVAAGRAAKGQQYTGSIQAAAAAARVKALQTEIDTRQQATKELLAAAEAAAKELDALEALARGQEEAESAAFKVTTRSKTLGEELEVLQRRYRALGDEVDFNKERLDLYRKAINDLIDNGVDPNDNAVRGLISTYVSLREEYDRQTEADRQAEEAKDREEKAVAALADATESYGLKLREVGASEEELAVIEQERVARSLRDAGVQESAIAEVIAKVREYQKAEAELATQQEEQAKLDAAIAQAEAGVAAQRDADMQRRETSLKSVTDTIINYRSKLEELGLTEAELLELERQRAIAAVIAAGGPADQIARAIALINEYYAVLADSLEGADPWEVFAAKAQVALGKVSSLLSAMSGLFTAIGERRMAEIDRELQAELAAAGLAEETELERLQAELDAAIAKGDAETADDLRQQIERLRITEDFEKKKAQVKYQAELWAWRVTLLKAIADTASAVIEALPNPALAIAAGVIGATETLTVLAQRPEPPALATGAIVLPARGGVPTVQAENGYPELSLNAGPEGMALLDQFADRVRGGPTTFILEMDSLRVAQATVDRINNGQVRVKL